MSQSILARGFADLATKRDGVRREARTLLQGVEQAIRNRDETAALNGLGELRSKLSVLDGLTDAMAETANAIVSNTEVPVTTLLAAAKPDEVKAGADTVEGAPNPDTAAEGTASTGPGEQVAAAGSTDTAGTNRRAR